MIDYVLPIKCPVATISRIFQSWSNHLTNNISIDVDYKPGTMHDGWKFLLSQERLTFKYALKIYPWNSPLTGHSKRAVENLKYAKNAILNTPFYIAQQPIHPRGKLHVPIRIEHTIKTKQKIP